MAGRLAGTRRPEADRDELEMTDGQLRMRVRAYEREKAWAPRYVANELAGTRQAAEATARPRRCATPRPSRRDPSERARLQREAAEAAALADVLEQRAADLAQPPR